MSSCQSIRLGKQQSFRFFSPVNIVHIIQRLRRKRANEWRCFDCNDRMTTLEKRSLFPLVISQDVWNKNSLGIKIRTSTHAHIHTFIYNTISWRHDCGRFMALNIGDRGRLGEPWRLRKLRRGRGCRPLLFSENFRKSCWNKSSRQVPKFLR